jgi:hypothetical protein
VSKNEQCRVVKYLVRRYFGALHLVGKSCGEVRIQHLSQPEILFDDISDSERRQLGGPRDKVGLPDHHTARPDRSSGRGLVTVNT